MRLLTLLSLALPIAANAGSQLYDDATKLMRGVPMFSTRQSDDRAVILELQMDYDLDMEQVRYTQAMEHLSDTQTDILRLLKESSELGNVDATFMLAEMSMYGNYSFPQNGKEALRYYHKVVELTPNATAYFNLGFIYATGLFGEVELDQARANLYYQFAFEEGDLRAAMVLGYRYLNAISLPYDCEKARYYYQIVAEHVKKIYDDAPLGGPHLDTYNIRVADFQDGIYGKGVGDMKTSLTRRSTKHDSILQNEVLRGDELSIYDQLYYNAIKHYEGSYFRPRNFTRAYRHASMAYRDGIAEAKRLQPYEKFYLAKCTYLMAHMHMRGEGVENNYTESIRLLEEALAIYPQVNIYNDLVLIYGKGPEEVRDFSKANHYLANSSAKFTSNDEFNYGFLAKQSETEPGIFHLGIEGYYHQAIVNDHSEGKKKCQHTTTGLKHFCEAFDMTITSLKWSLYELVEGRSQNALIGYSMAAEQGFEMAQSSAAFLMYQLPGILEEPPKIPKQRREMSKVYLTRSSYSFNLDSTVLLGDMYFDDGEYDKAVDCYEAAEGRHSSQASFNLGWLYENGLGVEQDFHLAKRHYDLALNRHSKAYLAVQTALLRLRFKSVVSKIFGKKIMSINEDEKRTWSDWMNLYQRVRDVTQKPSDYEVALESTLTPEVTEPQEDAILTEDVLLLLFFAGAFAMFWVVYMVQQRQLRRRAAEGEQNIPRPEIQVQFGFFAI